MEAHHEPSIVLHCKSREQSPEQVGPDGCGSDKVSKTVSDREDTSKSSCGNRHFPDKSLECCSPVVSIETLTLRRIDVASSRGKTRLT